MKPVKVVLLIVTPALILGMGGVIAAGMLGYIQIPGITPSPPVAEADLSDEPIEREPEPVAVVEPLVPPSPPPAPAPQVAVSRVDPDRGDRRLASLWNDLETQRLVEITQDWPEEELARVLLRMDPSAVAEYLAALPDARRASALSRRLRDLAMR